MKYLKNILLVGAALALFLSGAQAQSAFKTGNPLERIIKKEHVDQLGAGSRLVLVCRGSATATIIDIKDKKQRKFQTKNGRLFRFFHLILQVRWKGLPELRVRLDEADDVAEIFGALALATIGITPSFNLSGQSVLQ